MWDSGEEEEEEGEEGGEKGGEEGERRRMVGGMQVPGRGRGSAPSSTLHGPGGERRRRRRVDEAAVRGDGRGR